MVSITKYIESTSIMKLTVIGRSTILWRYFVMQKEIELKCLCDGLLNALRKMGLGKYSLRNYYYEGMWPLIKAYRKAGKELYDPVFTNEVVLGIQKQFQEGLIGNHINMRVRKMAAMMEEYSLRRCIVWHRIKPCPTYQLSAYYENITLEFKFWEERRNKKEEKCVPLKESKVLSG